MTDLNQDALAKAAEEARKAGKEPLGQAFFYDAITEAAVRTYLRESGAVELTDGEAQALLRKFPSGHSNLVQDRKIKALRAKLSSRLSGGGVEEGEGE